MERTLVAVAKALADDTRMEILRALARSGELSCGELVDLCSVGQSTVSHHLKALVEAGIVSARQAGQKSLHTLDTVTLRSVAADLLWLARTAEDGSHPAWKTGSPAYGLPDIGPGNVD